MNRKILPEAFELYRSMGIRRSYQAVAERLGLSKRTVASAAVRERWQARLAKEASPAPQPHEQRHVGPFPAALGLDRLRLLQWLLQELELEILRRIRIETPSDALDLVIAAMDAERALMGVGNLSPHVAMRKLVDTGCRVSRRNARRSEGKRGRRGR